MNKYTMRSNGALIEPVCKSKFAEYSISFRAPRLWNTLAFAKHRHNKIIEFFVLQKQSQRYLA